MPSAPYITAPMRQSPLAPRRRQKFRAARAFYLTIAIVTAIAVWSFLAEDAQKFGQGRDGSVWKRSDSSAAYSTNGGLVRRDEEVEEATTVVDVSCPRSS